MADARWGGLSGKARHSTPIEAVAAAVRQATRAPIERPPVTSGSPASSPAPSRATTAVHASSRCGAGAGDAPPGDAVGLLDQRHGPAGAQRGTPAAWRSGAADSAAGAVAHDERPPRPARRHRGSRGGRERDRAGFRCHVRSSPRCSHPGPQSCRLGGPAGRVGWAGRRVALPSWEEFRRNEPSGCCSRAQSISSLGDRLVPVALAFAVLNLTGSATSLGVVLAAQTIPLVLFVLVGGVWADRLPRRLVMATSDSCARGPRDSVPCCCSPGAHGSGSWWCSRRSTARRAPSLTRRRSRWCHRRWTALSFSGPTA